MTRSLTIALLILPACEIGATRGDRIRREDAVAAERAKTARMVGNLRAGAFNIRFYEDVKIGMDLAAVTAYLGDSGREVSAGVEGGRVVSVHEWSGPGGVISVTFTDGAVSAKSKRDR